MIAINKKTSLERTFLAWILKRYESQMDYYVDTIEKQWGLIFGRLLIQPWHHDIVCPLRYPQHPILRGVSGQSHYTLCLYGCNEPMVHIVTFLPSPTIRVGSIWGGSVISHDCFCHLVLPIHEVLYYRSVCSTVLGFIEAQLYVQRVWTDFKHEKSAL